MDNPVVLFSDDDADVVRAFERTATRAGLWVVADLESRAVGLARSTKPHLVILDLYQRVLGLELLAQLKAEPSTREVQVIMVSSRADDRNRTACLLAGASDFVAKPFDLTFFTSVARLAGQESRQRQVGRRAG